MKVTNKFALLALSIILTACGSGGGDGGPTPTDSGGGPAEEPPVVTLVFEFGDTPQPPKAFNVSPPSGMDDNNFEPGDTINAYWNMILMYSDLTAVEETKLYDVEIFLSTDMTLDDDDLRIVDAECQIPTTDDYACGQYASFHCVYALDNENTISCTSIPLGKLNGITDVETDTTLFLGAIPKTANLIFKACLQEEDSICTEAHYEIVLN